MPPASAGGPSLGTATPFDREITSTYYFDSPIDRSTTGYASKLVETIFFDANGDGNKDVLVATKTTVPFEEEIKLTMDAEGSNPQIVVLRGDPTKLSEYEELLTEVGTNNPNNLAQLLIDTYGDADGVVNAEDIDPQLNLPSGTDGDDTFVGTDGDDSYLGLGGDDDLSGLSGNDRLFGGDGRDNIDGGLGNDTLSAGGNASGAAGTEYLRGREGDDTYIITDQDFRPYILGEVDGNDRVIFEDHTFDDITSVLLDENNTLVLGFDNALGQNSFLTIRGIDQIEQIEFADGMVISNPAANIQNKIQGTPAADILRGTALGDVIEGLAGGDDISGLAGDDTIFGGDGRDNIDGGAGNDTLSAGSHSTGHLTLDAYSEYLRGQDGDDTYVITNVDFHPYILDETSGYDRIIFQDYNLDDIDFVYLNHSGYLSFDFTNALGQKANLTVREQDQIEEFVFKDGSIITDVAELYETNQDVFTGDNSDNVIRANDADNLIEGLDGDDDLTGLAGDDTIFGGDGRDNIDAGDENDTLSAGGHANAHLAPGAYSEYLRGRGGDDTYVITEFDFRPYILDEKDGFDRVVFQGLNLSVMTLISLNHSGYLSFDFTNALGQDANLTVREQDQIEEFVFLDQTLTTADILDII